MVNSTKSFAYVPEQDENMVYRLVGFFEYSQALRKFEKFIANTTPAELKIADQIVRDHSELAIYTNLSSRIEEPSTLSETSKQEIKQHSLAWMMSLARVEVSAMLAGFTSNTKPFEALPSTNFEKQQFRELLIDGLRTHYWALRKDTAVRKYWQTGSSSKEHAPLKPTDLVAYIRRTAVTIQFLRAVRSNLSEPAQQTELTRWQDELTAVEVRLRYCLSQHLGYKIVDHWTAGGCVAPMVFATRRAARVRSLQDIKARKEAKKRQSHLWLLQDPQLINFDCISYPKPVRQPKADLQQDE